MEPLVFDLLEFLLRNSESVISKGELIAGVWNGRIVSDSVLTSRMTAVRHAVGDSGKEQRLIRTAGRRGFRFIGTVYREQDLGQNDPDPRSRNQIPIWHQSPCTSDKPSIAVLPFINMSGDPEQVYFSDGLSEDVITELSRFREFMVIARNSTFAFRGQSVDVREIGRVLGAEYVVEGSVRRA